MLATASPEATAWRGGLEGEERLVHVESRNSIGLFFFSVKYK